MYWFSEDLQIINFINTLVMLPSVTPVVFIAVFILGNAFYAFVDLTGKPAWVLKYKIQEEKDVPVGH